MKLAIRVARSPEQMLPRSSGDMVNNLKKFVMDLVLSYPYRDHASGTVRVKRAVAASTAARYADEVAAYWREWHDTEEKIQLHARFKTFKAFLRKSMPGVRDIAKVRDLGLGNAG